MTMLMKQYGYSVFMLDAHPDSLALVQKLRTHIFHMYDALTDADKAELLVYDLLLLHQASSMRMKERITSYPLEQWWWHLNLIANNSLYVRTC